MVTVPTDPMKREVFRECLMKTTPSDRIEEMFASYLKSNRICDVHVPDYRDEVRLS